MKRCVIVGGAPIDNYEYIKQRLSCDDFFIYCDSGLKHKDKLGFEPDLIVGDFDSYDNPNLSKETIVLNEVKDDTDTEHAVNVALQRGFEDYVMIGVIGARMDHSLGNIGLMCKLFSCGKNAVIIDDFEEMTVVDPSNSPAFISDEFPFFSLSPLNGKASGIDISNAKYSGNNYTLEFESTLGVSNEPLKGGATVSVSCGSLLLIKILKNDKKYVKQ